MPRSLKLYVLWVVTAGALAFAVATFFAKPDPRIALTFLGGGETSAIDTWAGIAFWTALTLVASALPVKMPKGTQIAVAIAPIVAAMSLGGPAVAAWVATIGTLELRELRGKVPWYGTLANHAAIAFPAIVGASVIAFLRDPTAHGEFLAADDFVATMAGAIVFYVLNATLASTAVAIQT